MLTERDIRNLKLTLRRSTIALYFLIPLTAIQYCLAGCTFYRVYQVANLFGISLSKLLGHDIDFMGQYQGYYVYAMDRMYTGIVELCGSLFLTLIVVSAILNRKRNRQILEHIEGLEQSGTKEDGK
jgi:hypothetical protein